MTIDMDIQKTVTNGLSRAFDLGREHESRQVCLRLVELGHDDIAEKIYPEIMRKVMDGVTK